MCQRILKFSRAIVFGVELPAGTRWLSVSLAQLFYAGIVFAASPSPAFIEADVARVLKEMNVPGVAIAIVKDGEGVLAKGYGVRRAGTHGRVDENTLFGIASNSKAFTAVILAMLADEGKVAWDDPVIKHLPAFQMHDAYVTREITIRDVMIHNSGLSLGAGDLMWNPPTNFTAEETAARIRLLKPSSGFRGKYAYDNVLYVVAGQIISAVTGMPWEQVVADRILRPLGMIATNASVESLRGVNAAAPHSTVDKDLLQPIEPWSTANVRAAAGLNSNAHDMTRWMRLLLAAGKWTAGDRVQTLYSERQSREMWSIWNPIRINDPPTSLAATKPNFLGVGLGFFVFEYRGKKAIYHNGTLPGYTSRVTFVPELGLGITIMTNQWHSDGARRALTLRILDHYLGAPPTDWISAYRDVDRANRDKARDKIKADTAAITSKSPPSLPLLGYVGKYSDPWLGESSISAESEGLVMRFARSPGLVGDLLHWQHDTFVARWRDRSLRADSYISFTLNPDGSIFQAKMKPVSSETDFSFDFQDLLFTPSNNAK